MTNISRQILISLPPI